MHNRDTITFPSQQSESLGQRSRTSPLSKPKVARLRPCGGMEDGEEEEEEFGEEEEEEFGVCNCTDEMKPRWLPEEEKIQNEEEEDVYNRRTSVAGEAEGNNLVI